MVCVRKFEKSGIDDEIVRVRVIQLTEFRLKGWNRHVLRFCRENHPGGVEVRERRKDTSERSDVE